MIERLFHQNSTLKVKRSSLRENLPSPNMRVVEASKNDEDTPVEPGALTQKGWNVCTAVTDPNLFDTGNLSGGSTFRLTVKLARK